MIQASPCLNYPKSRPPGAASRRGWRASASAPSSCASARLRWPVPRHMAATLQGLVVNRVDRRGKYLLLATERGTALVHLGMSGQPARAAGRGAAGQARSLRHRARLRRLHPLQRSAEIRLAALDRGGPASAIPCSPASAPSRWNPLSTAITCGARARGRRVAIKTFLMNAAIVVGVGNIYASEALFRAGISPRRAAGRVSQADMARLAATVREVLRGSGRLRRHDAAGFLRRRWRAGLFQPANCGSTTARTSPASAAARRSGRSRRGSGRPTTAPLPALNFRKAQYTSSLTTAPRGSVAASTLPVA